MMGNDANDFAQDNPLVRALARWENEGGSLDAQWAERADAIQEDEHILRHLGVAVVACWNNLPAEIQRELFIDAASHSEPLHTAEIKEQIARFLHTHKNYSGEH